MIRPITPEEVTGEKVKLIPDEVFSAFNEMIAKKLVGGSSTFEQEEVISLIVMKMGSDGTANWASRYRAKIFQEGWLNIESCYRDAGWNVEYDKPAYNESYKAKFTFTRRR